MDPTGVLINQTERGRCTIDVLGLNERDLPRERRRKYEDVMRLFDALVVRATEKGTEWLTHELTRLKAANQEFAAVARRALGDAVDSLLPALLQAQCEKRDSAHDQ